MRKRGSISYDLVKAAACWWYRQSAPRDAELETLEHNAQAAQKDCGKRRILCRSGHGDKLVSVGLWGILGALVALGCWTPTGTHLIGFEGSVIALLLMGVSAGLYAIPLQVFLQDRPPSNLKGRMIATMNQANFIGILISGPLYQVFEAISSGLSWPISSVFWMMGLLVLPLCLFYRLDSRKVTSTT